MSDVLERLKMENIPYLLCGFSSLDRFFRVKEPGPSTWPRIPPSFPWRRPSMASSSPGLPLEDAALHTGDVRLVFRCVDSLAVPPEAPFTVMRLLYDPERNAFIDRLELYPDLRAPSLSLIHDSYPKWVGLCEAARLVSRYHYDAEGLPSTGPGGCSAAHLVSAGLAFGSADLPRLRKRAWRFWRMRALWRRRGPSSRPWPGSRTPRTIIPRETCGSTPWPR